jgi:hypothetical protein
MLYLVFIIVFLYLMNIINKKIENYVGIPLYTGVHEYLKDSKKYLYKKMCVTNHVSNLKKNLIQKINYSCNN